MERTLVSRVSAVGRLLRRDVALGYRGTLIAVASVAGGVILLSLLEILISGGWDKDQFHQTIFTLILFVGGLIYTSLSFRELHSPVAAVPYLTLPATPGEKVATKVIITAVGYALAAVVFTTVVAAAGEGLNWLVLRKHHRLFNPLSTAALRSLALYLVVQSVFLVGAAYYRKMAFLKTAGMVSLVVLVILLAALAVGAVLLRDHIVVLPGGRGYTLSDPLQEAMEKLSSGAVPAPPALEVLRKIGDVLFWGILAPLSWVLTWLKVREKEV